MTFCPQCGDDAVDVFCESCLRAQHPLIADITLPVLTKCATCDRIKVKNSWQPAKEFDRFFEGHITFIKRATVLAAEFPTPVIEPDAKEFTLPLLVTGTVSKHIPPYDEEYEVHVKILKEPCDRCSLATSAYFEGILQLRNPREEVIAYIEKQAKRREDLFITKAEDVRGGIDFYFTDQQALQPFVHELKKQFGGVVKTQSKLHTYDHQRSKKVYRLTCLIRIPKFARGDIIETKDRLIKISKMGSRISGFDLRRRKNTSIPCPTDDEVYIHDTENVTISRTRPKPAFLHPDTYQEALFAHPANLDNLTEVPVVQDGRGKWYAARKLPGEHK